MKTLVIAPHPDDEILGCGGTIAKRIREGREVWVCVVTEGCEPMYSSEFIKQEEQEMQKAHKELGVQHTIHLKLPSAMLDTMPRHEINEGISAIVDMVKPDEVFIPHHGDIHFDHQIVSEAALVAVRPKADHLIRRVLAYEVLSETDWNVLTGHNAFIPTAYEDITGYLKIKKKAMEHYHSQLKPFPSARSLDAIHALALHRGAVVGVKAAEAFEVIREVLA